MNKLIVNQLPAESLRGKRAFVRIDVDSQHLATPALGDEDKLRQALPTLQYLVNVGARIIIGTHVGDPGGKFSATNAALAGQGLTSHRQLIVAGSPADEILRVADEMGADLIAMGSHGRTGVLRLLMGSVSRKVLDQARCPVLIVRIPDEEMAKAGLIEMSGVN